MMASTQATPYRRAGSSRPSARRVRFDLAADFFDQRFDGRPMPVSRNPAPRRSALHNDLCYAGTVVYACTLLKKTTGLLVEIEVPLLGKRD